MMNNEELILKMLGQMQEDMVGVRNEVTGIQQAQERLEKKMDEGLADVRKEIEGVRSEVAEVRSEVAVVRSEMTREFKAVREEIGEVHTELTNTRKEMLGRFSSAQTARENLAGDYRELVNSVAADAKKTEKLLREHLEQTHSA